MKILEDPQGTPEWFAARIGLPTASNFSRIITPAKGEYASAADTYAAELVAESLGWDGKSFTGNSDTDRGNVLEREAIAWLEMMHDMKGRAVGLCLSDCGRYGASPDYLLDDGRPVESKAPDLHTFIKWRINGGLPVDHKVQVHGEMLVTGSDSCVFIAYPPPSERYELDPMMIEVPRDSFTAKVEECVLRFCDRLDEIKRLIGGPNYETLFAKPLP